MECALFVHQLNDDRLTVWLSNQSTTASWDIFYHLRKWADGIGEGLKDCIVNEKEVSVVLLLLSTQLSFVISY